MNDSGIFSNNNNPENQPIPRPQPLLGEQDEEKRNEILNDSKIELAKLIELCIELEKVTPLVFEEEEVVPHLQRIEEFFDTLSDNLTEVKDYMIALLESVEESNDSNIQ